MIGSKQTHTFIRKTERFGKGRVHGNRKMKYDIEFGIDDMKIEDN